MDFFKNFSLFDVDLAAEASDLLRGSRQTEIPGVVESIRHIGQITIRDIQIQTEEGANLLQRPIGTYITLQSPPLQINDPSVHTDVIQAITENLPRLITEKISLKPQDCVLLVGLGNREAAADSLGPHFVARSPITRHYVRYAPEALAPGMRPCCALAPGVLGTTGLETLDIIEGVVKKIRPALIIVVDALSAQNVERIGCTLQLANNGIQPGSGLGSKRQALTQETLGVPVIAIGCPTIVSAHVIAKQVLEAYGKKAQLDLDISSAESAIRDTFSFYGANLAVTPKDIEDIVFHAADMIAQGVSQALFPDVSSEQLALYAAHR